MNHPRSVSTAACSSEVAMDEFAAFTKPRIYLANPIRLRLTEIFAIEEKAAALGWDRQEFIAASHCNDAGLAVAESEGAVIGVALYQSLPLLEPARTGRLAELLRWWRIWCSGSRTSDPRDLELLRIGIQQGWRRRGIARALLTKIHQESRYAGGCIRALAPESNLAVQLLLKKAGYKAIRILRNACGGEDGFLMQRACG